MQKNLYLGHFPSKTLGQHFLIDQNIINSIIKIIDPKYTDVFIEIGPGLGALTASICNYLEKLIVIEYDTLLANRLHQVSYSHKLKIFCHDASNFNFFILGTLKKRSIRILGNLPYNIAIKIIFHLFQFNEYIHDIHVMLQKEVADRFLAKVGTKDYGRLTVLIQYYCKVFYMLGVSPIAFFPIPKVSSVFIRLIPHKNSKFMKYNVAILRKIVTVAFNQRRKMIKHSLSEFFTEKHFLLLGIPSFLRAENISLLQYCKLTKFITNKLYYKV